MLCIIWTLDNETVSVELSKVLTSRLLDNYEVRFIDDLTSHKEGSLIYDNCAFRYKISEVVDQPTSNLAIARFRNADVAERRELARMGFELETQSTEGQTYDDCQGEVNEEAINEHISDRIGEIEQDREEFIPYITDDLIALFTGKRHREIRDVFATLGLNTLHEVVEAGVCTTDYDNIIDNIESCLRDGIDSDDFRVSTEIGDHISIPANMEAVEDSSVSGFEFRTIGPLTYVEANDAAKTIFKYKHTIDNKCSFHIHVSVPGVKHGYGSKLQAAMIEYLLTNISKVPQSVRNRWAGSQEYFKPHLSREKYSFVHMHHQGTWEFRCFGNVKNADDAAICFDLALEALQYGYKVLNNEVTLLKDLADLERDEFYDICRQSMCYAKDLSVLVEEFLKIKTQAA